MTPLAVHASGGAQLDPSPHGDVNLGIRYRGVRAEIFSDTLEFAWEPAQDRGRAWLLFRGNAASAELFISPWQDGAPAADGEAVAYLGVEGGVVRYGPAGLWGGARVWARGYVFSPYGPSAERMVDPVGRGDFLLGYWTSPLTIELRPGAHVEARPRDGATFQPHVEAEAHWHPDRAVAPIVEGWAGLASGQSALTRTRLGGLNPYVVPMAGAGWAEWWVEDYVAARVGAAAGATDLDQPSPRVRARAHLFADAAAFTRPYDQRALDGPAVGFGGGVLLGFRHARAEASLGFAPWIPRRADVSRLALYFRVGLDWTTLHPSGVERH